MKTKFAILVCISVFFFFPSVLQAASLQAASLQAASLQAASPKAIYPGALPILAGVENVREDLQLTSLQRAVLDSIRNEYRSEAQHIYITTRFKDPASRARAEADLRRLQLKYNKRVLSTLNRIQKSQLRQIQIQILSGFLLFRNSVQDALSLDPTQKAQIARIEAKDLKILRKLNGLAVKKKITPLQRVIKLHALRKTSSAEALRVLSPAQKKQLLNWAKSGHLPPMVDWP